MPLSPLSAILVRAKVSFEVQRSQERLTGQEANRDTARNAQQLVDPAQIAAMLDAGAQPNILRPVLQPGWRHQTCDIARPLGEQ